jgi:hypothetical protein
MWSQSAVLARRANLAVNVLITCCGVFFPVSLTAADRTLTELTERRFAAFILYN